MLTVGLFWRCEGNTLRCYLTWHLFIWIRRVWSMPVYCRHPNCLQIWPNCRHPNCLQIWPNCRHPNCLQIWLNCRHPNCLQIWPNCRHPNCLQNLTQLSSSQLSPNLTQTVVIPTVSKSDPNCCKFVCSSLKTVWNRKAWHMSNHEQLGISFGNWAGRTGQWPITVDYRYNWCRDQDMLDK